MLRVLFLSLILFSSVVFVQAQENPESYKFFECGRISSKLLKEKYDEFTKSSKKTAIRKITSSITEQQKKVQNVKCKFEIR